MAKQRVLILCTGNSTRSQMAEGLLRWMADDRFEVCSAGTRPVGLNPNAVTAMAEIGVDISGHRSKSVDEFDGQRFGYVITLCDNARQSCPVLPGAGRLVAGLPTMREGPASPRESGAITSPLLSR